MRAGRVGHAATGFVKSGIPLKMTAMLMPSSLAEDRFDEVVPPGHSLQLQSCRGGSRPEARTAPGRWQSQPCVPPWCVGGMLTSNSGSSSRWGCCCMLA